MGRLRGKRQKGERQRLVKVGRRAFTGGRKWEGGLEGAGEGTAWAGGRVRRGAGGVVVIH